MRRIRGADARAARALVEAESGGTPYAARARWALETALEGRSDESVALVAEDGGELLGFVAYGMVAGTSGAARVHGVVVTAAARLHGVASRLCEAMAAGLARDGARFVLAEVPDDPVAAPGRELLRRCGFVEEARVADYFSDGVALVFMRRPVSQA